MKKTNARFFCTDCKNGSMKFYMEIMGEQFFLFQTSYFSNPIYREYSRGKSLEDVFSNTKHTRQQNIKERIKRNTKYLDREYELGIFSRSKRAA